MEVGGCILVVITYDVNTENKEGKKRLQKVAKQCLNFGQRVQNSVFECVLDHAQAIDLKNRLLKMINPKTDSLRFYYLGNNYKSKVEHFGAKPTFYIEGPLIL